MLLLVLFDLLYFLLFSSLLVSLLLVSYLPCFFTSCFFAFFVCSFLASLILTDATRLLTRERQELQRSLFHGCCTLTDYLSEDPQDVGSANRKSDTGAHTLPHTVHKVRTGLAWSHIEDNMVSRVQRCPFLLPSYPGPSSSFLGLSCSPR